MQTEVFSNKIELIELFRKPSKEQVLIGDIIQELANQLDPRYSLIDKLEIQADQGSLEEILLKENPDLAKLWQKKGPFERIIDHNPHHEGYYKELEEKKKSVIYYYVEQKPLDQRTDYYIFTPDFVTILRVPQSELGPGVLGVAYIGAGLVKILDILYGDDFVEVKKHELLHIQYPERSESEIRQMTKQAFNYQTRYQ